MVSLDLLQLKHMVSDNKMKGRVAKLSENCTPQTLFPFVRPFVRLPENANTHKNYLKIFLTFPRDIYFHGTHLDSDACIIVRANSTLGD